MKKLFFFLLNRSPQSLIPIFSTLITLLISTQCFGQRIRFEYLNKNNGLPNNTINCMVQDTSGFMWFGTRSGLARYDGYSFKTFFSDPTDSTSIPDNFIRTLYVSKKGQLYIGTLFHGFCIYDPLTETFKRFTPDPTLLHPSHIFTITEDINGRIWIGTSGGFTRYNPETGKFEHFKIPKEPGVTFTHQDFISSIYPDKDGRLWMYSLGNKISIYDPILNTFQFIQFSKQTLDRQILNRGGIVFKDKNQNVWIGTEFEGLYKYNPATKKGTQYCIANGKLASDIIVDIIQDASGTIWVATDGGGLARYISHKDSFIVYKYDVENPHSISTNAVYCLYETKPEILWIGTYGAGINIYKKSKEKFTPITNKGKKNQCLSYKSVLCFEESKNGKIWIGTDGGGLNLYNPVNKQFHYYYLKNHNQTMDVIKTIYTDKRGNVWLGSYGKGACKMDTTGKITFYTSQMNPDHHHLQSSSIWAISEDRLGNIWLGLLGNGIDIYSHRTRRFKHIEGGGMEELIEGSIHVLFKDSRNRMWVGGETHGIALYDEVSDKFIKYNTENSQGLLSDKVKTIFEDASHKLWFGLENGGLCLLVDEKNKIFKTYTTANGLPGNSVYGILQDDRNRLWISTDNGLSGFTIKHESFRNFDTNDGLLSNEFMYGAMLKDKTGNIYFGGTEGMIIFNPDRMWYNLNPPNVYITSIKILNNDDVNAKEANKKHLEKLHLTNELILRPEDYSVTFEFAALDYLSPSKNQYAFKLEGFDKDWVYTNSSKRFATYTSLPPGNYTFKIKASNNDGIWNYKGIALQIKVLPPWWETWWFRFTALAIIVVSIVLIIISRIRFEDRRRKILERLVQARTVELKEANDELQKVNKTKDKLFAIVSHDLKGPALSLKKLSEMLESNFKKLPDDEKVQFISHFRKSAVAQANLVTNLLTWARVQSGNIHLVKSETTIKECIQRVVESLQLPAKEKEIKVETIIADEIKLFLDKNMLETVIRNLLNNAIKFTPVKGTIRITQEKRNSQVYIAIKDSGIGIDEKLLQSLFTTTISTKGTSGETGTGLGLMICKEFTEANEGRLEVSSKRGEGTEFRIIFEIKKEEIVSA